MQNPKFIILCVFWLKVLEILILDTENPAPMQIETLFRVHAGCFTHCISDSLALQHIQMGANSLNDPNKISLVVAKYCIRPLEESELSGGIIITDVSFQLRVVPSLTKRA